MITISVKLKYYSFHDNVPVILLISAPVLQSLLNIGKVCLHCSDAAELFSEQILQAVTQL